METRGIEETTPQLDAQLENAAIDYELELVLLRNQVEFYQVARDGTVSGSHPKKPDMVANIKQQFALAVQEKDAAIEMWQSALKEVSCLEEELKTYQGYMKNNMVQTQLDKVKEQYSEAITLLEAKLAWTQAELKKERSLRDDLSAELKELKLEHEASCKLVEAQKDQLQEALKMQAETERELSAARDDATAARELEAALARCHESVADLRARHHEACDKVEEAVAALESACAERERAVLAEASAREETAEAQAALTRLIDDAGARVKEEVERVKSRYNQQIEKVLFDVKMLEDKLADKSSQLERLTRDCEEAQDERESPARRPGAPDMGARLQGLFRELGELQQRNARLSAERDALQRRLDELCTRHERELQRGEQRRSALEGRLREATALRDQARQLDETQQSVVECLQRRELERGVQERDDLIGRLRAAQARGVETAAELHRHLETQLRVKNKWKRTVKTVTREFEARVKELRRENAALRDENHRLKEELEALRADALG
ncbi:myosin heavy chain, skeletal muscle, adult-like isoform X2 [Bacillus rossius redtenbacheri]|uniref:myosin heavy chain, skeletal muscle, adult-like isoform X2 n=1 Tax=Bacillus rossius redtenbacheri TaxID=93214 RepID=UPI002FDE2A3D